MAYKITWALGFLGGRTDRSFVCVAGVDWLTKLQDAAVETAATQAKPAFAG